MPTYAVVNGENPGPVQHPAITLVGTDGAPWDASENIPDGTFSDASGLLVRNPSNLRRWSIALGDAYGAVGKQPVLTCVGDSITAGFSAINTTPPLGSLTNADRAVFRKYGWVGTLRSLLAARYGDAGEGYMFPAPIANIPNLVEDRVTLSGVYSNSITVGPQESGIALTLDKSLTFVTTEACTQLDIIAWWAAGTSAPFTYTVDGGGSQTGPTMSGSDTMYTHSITGLSDAVHTLVINGPATLRCDIGGVVARKATGVLVHRMGRGSASTAITAGTTLGAPSVHQNRVLNATFTQTATDLAIIMMRYNDWEADMSKATFKANIQKMADVVVAGGGCVLLIPDPRGNPTGTRVLADSVYLDAMREISDATDHVACTDLDAVWVSYAAALAAGLLVDNVHPGSKGQGSIARMMFDVVTRTYT